MNRKAETFFDAVTHLREDLVEEAQDYVFRKKRTGWRTFGSLAACVALVMSLGLLMLPKGCGGAASGSGSDMNTSGAPSTSDAAPRPPQGDGMDDMGGYPSDGAAPEDAPPVSSEAPEEIRFSAQVAEVLEDGLLVEPFDSLPGDPRLVRVPTAGLEALPEFYPGDVVMAACGGIVQEDGEAVAQGVTELDLVEPERP